MGIILNTSERLSPTQCQPVYLFVFPPHLQMGSQAKLPKGILALDHCLLPSSVTFPCFLLSEDWEGKVGLRERPGLGMV